MTTEKQQTPLQKLIEFMDITPYVGNEIYDKANSLLSEEKQMVIDAYDLETIGTGEDYFNETFQ